MMKKLSEIIADINKEYDRAIKEEENEKSQFLDDKTKKTSDRKAIEPRKATEPTRA